MTRILDERVWLGPDSVGQQGNRTLFFVIQHAELAVQERYLPMLSAAVARGDARASRLAYLEDRVALRKGGRQVYGSQVMLDFPTGESCVQPLLDPANVNERRAAVGLNFIEEYIVQWGLTWDPVEYEPRLPLYLERQRAIEQP